MSKVAKATLALMIATMLSKVLGFGRELVLASSYGMSSYTDAYLIALNMPNTIFAAVGTAIATTFIPMYYTVSNEQGEEGANKFTNNIFNIVLTICIVVAILGIVFTKPLVKVFAMGFEGETLELAIYFTRIIIVGIIFMGLSNLMTAFLQAKNNFSVPGLIGIPFNVFIIIGIILSVGRSPFILAICTFLGLASQFLFQLPFAIKKGYRYKPYIKFKDKDMKNMLWLVGPVFIGVAVNQINTMVDRTLASTLTEGSVTALNYSNRLNLFVISMFIASISTVIYPMLSKLSSDDNKEKFTEAVVTSVNTITLLVIPVSVGAMVLATPIVKFLFERGEFNAHATAMTASALVFYSIGLIGFGIRDILGKVFYSLQDTKTPMINGAIAMGINIVLNIILVRFMGHNGLAFATSISAILTIVLLFRSLKKKVGYFGQDKIIKVIIKSFVSAVIMGVISVLTYNILIGALGSGTLVEMIALFVAIIIGAIAYVILIIMLKVEEITIISDKILKKIKNKK
ncbi:murein biosynthesis integral membrane protein MurJ [Romboutsia sp.]|uniref:murein biosynthesis integral membrane protein MurJ n=1 Tax=Romboutsia sp. TaxID=1965302 RepID=UPI002B5C8A2A|nr:murein biosynthesis integral membrane protein MurJ [Romboutsia sp.]HSQ87301.1 murein biosynthesis integral membrane protein MurJ [Romboutsia sp.]